ncbi:uncharacterized protein SPAPADRAFT_57844, partial [Spathaspora passalidarum NRRL Y-27907]
MSHLWAAKAAHKNNQSAAFIPGSSRWISNELSLQFSSILDADEDKNNVFIKRYSELNTLMDDVLKGNSHNLWMLKHDEEKEKEYVVEKDLNRVIPDISFDLGDEKEHDPEPVTLVASEHVSPVVPDTSYVMHHPVTTSPVVRKV